MTFGALIAVFFIRSEGRTLWGHLQLPATLWFTTVILLASSGTLEAGKRALMAGDRLRAYRQFVATLALGIAFLAGQIVAWLQVRSAVVMKENAHSWFVFLFIVLHGLHILLGLLGTGALVGRTREPASGPRYQAKTKAVALGASIFWHYLDFLWIVLFGLLLFWKR